VTVIPRGYAGRTDTADQYFICQHCGQITYEIVATSLREIRLHRYEAGGAFHREGHSYQIKRILKVGFDEYLLYLQFAPPPPPEPVSQEEQEGGHPAPERQS
jgi:hypothetical protein